MIASNSCFDSKRARRPELRCSTRPANTRPPEAVSRLSWTTMPEQLEARGISWKHYSAADSTFVDGDNTLLFFKQYHGDPVLMAKGMGFKRMVMPEMISDTIGSAISVVLFGVTLSLTIVQKRLFRERELGG